VQWASRRQFRSLKNKKGNNTMSNTPKLYAYAVKDRGTGKKAIFTRVGAAFAHQKGQGLTLQLEAYPVGGKIVLLPPKANEGTSDTFEGEAAQ
jgi:hypothetical protein